MLVAVSTSVRRLSQMVQRYTYTYYPCDSSLLDVSLQSIPTYQNEKPAV